MVLSIKYPERKLYEPGCTLRTKSNLKNKTELLLPDVRVLKKIKNFAKIVMIVNVRNPSTWRAEPQIFQV